jgi:hypothetical protein
LPERFACKRLKKIGPNSTKIMQTLMFNINAKKKLLELHLSETIEEKLLQKLRFQKIIKQAHS